jgi:hypothetical protein
MGRTGRLYVQVGLARGDDHHAQVIKYGPTSESREMLRTHEQNWPSRTECVAVLPVLRGGLLRVSKRAADCALLQHLRQQ